MLVRLKTHEPDLAGYLYAYIDSFAGYEQIARLPYGGSIPHFDEKGISSVPVPLMPRQEMLRISRKVLSAFDARDEALDCERAARSLVEQAIEKGAGYDK
jgi:type I restriction enzyme S subunit